jgi:hypothetical protein
VTLTLEQESEFALLPATFLDHAKRWPICAQNSYAFNFDMVCAEEPNVRPNLDGNRSLGDISLGAGRDRDVVAA